MVIARFLELSLAEVAVIERAEAGAEVYVPAIAFGLAVTGGGVESLVKLLATTFAVAAASEGVPLPINGFASEPLIPSRLPSPYPLHVTFVRSSSKLTPSFFNPSINCSIPFHVLDLPSYPFCRLHPLKALACLREDCMRLMGSK